MQDQVILAAVALALSACTALKSNSEAPVAAVEVPAGSQAPSKPASSVDPAMAPDSEPSSAALATTTCSADQFVACKTGEDCATKGGVLVHPHACFDRAADACGELSCEHGCNLYGGTPNQVLCAPNASSSSHMKRCAGLAGWICPENMRCEITEKGFDVMGQCVPEA